MTLINLIMCICSLFVGWFVGVGIAIDIKDIKPKVVFMQFIVILLYAILLYVVYSYDKWVNNEKYEQWEQLLTI